MDSFQTQKAMRFQAFAGEVNVDVETLDVELRVYQMRKQELKSCSM